MWSDGYVTETEYADGFFPELSPTNLMFSTLLARIDWQVPRHNLRYLELGFGQGTSLNINAAVTPGEYWGTDFHPPHAVNALELAKSSDVNAHILDDSFEDLLHREDLPSFDIIVLHGIWSWVSNKNRSAIVEILRKHLKPGGICYISYNALPGWSGPGPIQHLLRQHVEMVGRGTIRSQMEDAISFMETLAKTGAKFFEAEPRALEKLKTLRNKDIEYLAHEYLNAHWSPTPFHAVATDLKDAKLSFGASTRMMDHFDQLNFPKEARDVLTTIEDPIFLETVKDYYLNRQFRNDIFIKGSRRLSSFEVTERWRRMSFSLVGNPEKPPQYVTVRMGKAPLPPQLCNPVIEALMSDASGSKTVLEIHAQKSCAGLAITQVIEALQLLCISGFVTPAQSSDVVEAALGRSMALNRELCRRSEFSGPRGYLAVPVIGSGLSISRVDGVFLRAEMLGMEDVPAYTWECLKSQGDVLKKDGNPLMTDEDNIAELKRNYSSFLCERRPLLKRLGAVE